MHVPVATYRLQINDDFTLDDAREITPYLSHLGVTDLYLSPVMEARRGSRHGYDVTDPTRIRDSIGGIDALHALADEAHRHHMGIIVDIVPNHMAASIENPWWRDVLRHGTASKFAGFFDTDLDDGRLALPVLDDTLERVLQRGGITVDARRDELICGEVRLPLAPDTAGTNVDEMLRRQHYRLVPWWSAAEQTTYRRFFDIPDLVALRIEEDAPFEATHSLIRRLAAEGVITGLRVDHVDGLRDPADYLRRLRDFVRGPDGEPLFTVVEKILAPSETLPSDWSCEGTTGYEFLSLSTALLLEPRGHADIDAFYRRITGDAREFNDVVREKKLLVMDGLFGGELASLAVELAGFIATDPVVARRALVELTGSMAVYRTYTRDFTVRAEDRGRVDAAADDAIRCTEDALLQSTIDALRRILLLEAEAGNDAHLDWVMRWQQFTGPVMAKGFEDTALYCHNALLAANEVGTDPAHPTLTPDELHDALVRRSAIARSLNATATHDTKRGEDTRARIAVLTEIPDQWRRRLRRWIRQGDEWKNEDAADDETVVPSADVDSLLYQTLVGAWPLRGLDDRFRERVQEYMMKAVREAKEQTSWRKPDEDYESALNTFIERLMAAFGREGLAEDIAAFAQRIASNGALNAIAQMLLKVTAPGIPDFYQGTELWSFTLVDPDNRAPVEFDVRQQLFRDVEHLRDVPDAAAARALLDSWADGRIKLLATAVALRFRATHRDIFEQGEVVPLPATGSRAEHVFAFARRLDDRACVTILPRWTAALGDAAAIPADAWRDTRIPLPPDLRSAWHNALTGETCAAAGELILESVLASLPFALLEVSQPIGA